MPLIWITHEGVRLAQNGAADAIKPASFPAFGELLASFRAGGGRIGVCPPCKEDPRYHRRDPGAECELDGAQALLAEMRCRQTLSF